MQKTSNDIKTKYSEIGWLGDIPEDWQVKKLKFVFKYFTGATPDSGKGKYYSEIGSNWITISDLNGRFTSESKNKITEIAVRDKNMKIAPAGSLLYSFKLSVGQMAFVSKDTYTNEAIFAILPQKNVNLDFWYYALYSYLIENANENIYGAKIFNQQLIDNSFLLVPSSLIQKKIGNYLDLKTEQIKNFIDDKRKLIALLEEQKKTIIYDAITKGLDRNIKTKPSGVEWLADIPEDWQVKKLKFVFKYFTGATPDSGKAKYYSETGFNWITISDLKGKFTSESKNKITEIAVKDKNMKIAPAGSLLYSFKLSVGQMAFVSKDTYTNEAIFAILPQKNVNLDFWYYALYSYLIENANENIYGAKIFNQQLIDNSFLLVPSSLIQKKIVCYLDKEQKKIDQVINMVQQEIKLIEEYKKSIIYHAVTGKIEKLLTNE